MLLLGLSPEQLAIAIAGALAAAFVRGLAGFGMAILLVPVLALAIPPAEAVVTSNFVGIFIGTIGLRALIGESERSALVIAAQVVVATPLGVWLLAQTDPALARFLIAIVALVAFLLVLLPQRPDGHQPSRLETGLTGLSSGLLTGFAGMPGPPVVPYYLRRRITPQLARASMLTVFLAASYAGVGSALALGVATWREPLLAAVLFPTVLFGNWVGTLAFGKVSDAVWRSFTGLVLGAAAVAALVRLL